MKIALPQNTVIRGKARAYRIIGTISDKGGFSFTYLAEEVGHPANRFTVKELYLADRCDRENNGTTVKWDSDFRKFRESFESEARFVAMCDACDGIVREYDFISANNTLYLILEHIDGLQLNKFTETIYATEPERVIALVQDLCRALHFIHTKNSICHFDLKPNNVMIEKGTERLVLIDFGSSVHFDSDGIKTVAEHIDTNSRGYTAPEIMNIQINTSKLTIKEAVRADVYGLGAVAFFLITRKHPPQSGIGEYVAEELDALSPQLKSAYAPLIRAIRQSLVYNADKRLPDIAAFAEIIGLTLPTRNAEDPEEIPTECDDQEIPTDLGDQEIPTELGDDDTQDIPTDETESPAPDPTTGCSNRPDRPQTAGSADKPYKPNRPDNNQKADRADKPSKLPLYILSGLVPVLLAALVWSIFFREPAATVTRPEPAKITKPHINNSASADNPDNSVVPDTTAAAADPEEAPANTEEYRFPNGNIWYGPLYEGKPDGIGELHAFHTTTLGDSTLYDGWYIRNAVFENGLFCSGDIYDPAGNYRYTYIP